jgi:peptidoglycan hydrolase CwlO-like protein
VYGIEFSASYFLTQNEIAMGETTRLGFAQIILPPAILVAVIFFIIRVAINQINQTIITNANQTNQTMNQLIQTINARFNDVNARIDDLKSKMDSDRANLAKMVESVDKRIDGVNKRLENLNQNFVRHLETHAVSLKQTTD